MVMAIKRTLAISSYFVRENKLGMRSLDASEQVLKELCLSLVWVM